MILQLFECGIENICTCICISIHICVSIYVYLLPTTGADALVRRVKLLLLFFFLVYYYKKLKKERRRTASTPAEQIRQNTNVASPEEILYKDPL